MAEEKIRHGLSDLAALSKVLDFVDGDTFDDLQGRINVQKKIYLLQEFAVDLGYRFQWNVFGPYSKDLARDCTALGAYRDEVREIAEPLNFKGDAEEKMQRVKSLLKAPPDTDLSDAAWLELISSVHMLADNVKNGSSSLSEEQMNAIREDLVARKPYFQDVTKVMPQVWTALGLSAGGKSF
jgi:uncharacterized protein YwgA